MAGVEDGVADALFRFTRPVTGGYFWCPPMKDGQVVLPEDVKKDRRASL